MTKQTWILAIALVLIGTILLAWQAQQKKQITLRPAIKAVVDSLENGQFEGSNLNMMGREPIASRQFARFVFLVDSATTQELEDLTNHRSPVVRSYIFDALAERNSQNFLDLLEDHLKDSLKFRTRSFDMISFSSVAEHLKYTTLPYYLSRNSPPSSHYNFLRNLAVSKEVPTAIIAMAKFKKAEDFAIIEAYLDDPALFVYAISAIVEFPLPKIYPRLLQLHGQDLNNKFPSLSFCIPFYQAIIQFKQEESISVLQAALQAQEPFSVKLRKIAIFVALQKFPDPYFQSIRDAITLTKDEREAVNELLKEAL